MNRAGSNRAVALVAERGHRRHIHQPRILRTVRCVAGHTALALYRSMLIDERTALVTVALGADRALISRGLQVVWTKGAVSIVAVGALHQSFIHLVMNGHVELGFLLSVAAIAKRRLRGSQQVLLLIAGMCIRIGSEQVQRGLQRLGRIGAMDCVATHAADPCLGMRRTQEIRMRSSVAVQAGCVYILRRSLRGIEDLAGIAAAINVRLACTMAVLTSDASAVSVHQGHLCVRIIGKLLSHFIVTCSACLRADILRCSSALGGRTGRFASRRRCC